jgi:hypothetical protein
MAGHRAARTAKVLCRFIEFCALWPRFATAIGELVRRGELPDTLLFLEHPPVITLGRGSHPEHLLASRGTLEAAGATVWETTRGGDITYHGPGQLVGYGILDLRQHGRDVGRYLVRRRGQLASNLAEGGGFVAIHVDGGGTQHITTMGPNTNGWGVQLTNKVKIKGFDIDIRIINLQLGVDDEVIAVPLGGRFCYPFADFIR